MEKTIYQQLVKAGVTPEEIDYYESDLYVKKTPVSEGIISTYEYKSNVQIFTDQIDKTLWYSIPFANDHFWDRVDKKIQAMRKR